MSSAALPKVNARDLKSSVTSYGLKHIVIVLTHPKSGTAHSHILHASQLWLFLIQSRLTGANQCLVDTETLTQFDKLKR